MPQVHQLLINRLERHSAQLFLYGAQNEQSLAEGRADRIDQTDSALREILHEFLRGQFRTMEGTADAGGHAHEKNVLAAFQNRTHFIQIALRIDLRGGNISAFAHGVIKCDAVKSGGIDADICRPIDCVMEGNDGNILCRSHFCGNICRSISHDSKHTRSPLFI